MIGDSETFTTDSSLNSAELLERCQLEVANAEFYLSASIDYVERVELGLRNRGLELSKSLITSRSPRARHAQVQLAASYRELLDLAASTMSPAGVHAREAHESATFLTNEAWIPTALRDSLRADMAQIVESLDEARRKLKLAIVLLQPRRITRDQVDAALASLAVGLVHLDRARERTSACKKHLPRVCSALRSSRSRSAGELARATEHCCVYDTFAVGA